MRIPAPPEWPTWAAPTIAAALSAILFLTTLQTDLAGSLHPYTTDVGEIQNALARWGTIHFTGYPLYLMTGSALVSAFRLVGINPAAAASLVSLIWGAATAVVVVLLAERLGVRRIPALMAAVLFSVTTSMWIDSSMAELHSFSMLFTALILLFAVRFHASGTEQDLIWLAILTASGVLHQRAVAGLLPALAIFVWPHRMLLLRRIPLMIGIGAASFLVYLYLPLREWMGAEWTFGETDTWAGFWAMVLDIKNARDADIVLESSALSERIGATLTALHDDMPLWLMVPGLAGLWLAVASDRAEALRTRLALTAAWVPYAGVPLLIYEGFIGDAILAVKLPVSMLAAVGLGLVASRAADWRPQIEAVAAAGLAIVVAVVGWRSYPAVIAITQDRTLEMTLDITKQAANPGEPLLLSIIWSRTYWGAAYAQDFRGEFEGVTLVDHNADFNAWLDDGYRVVTLAETFFVLPPDWWADQLGTDPVLEAYAPGLVEVRRDPRTAPAAEDAFTVNDELLIREATAVVDDPATVHVQVRWQAARPPTTDYRVAVHLVDEGGALITQADAVHPVEGWAPTSTWAGGQRVIDAYQLEAVPPEGATVRITAYTIDEAGAFVNGDWYEIEITRPE